MPMTSGVANRVHRAASAATSPASTTVDAAARLHRDQDGRRGNLSASTPPGIDRRSSGPSWAKTSRPTNGPTR